MRPVLRILLILGGILCIAAGIIGIFLPLLPTTPFLLLAGLMLANASPAIHRWLRSNRLTGPYLEAYRGGGGMSRRRKIFPIGLLWGTLLISGILTRQRGWIAVLLAVIGTGVTIHLVKLPESDR